MVAMVRRRRPSRETVAVLEELLKDPTADHYGFAIMGRTCLRSGTVYPILARLEKEGWLASFSEEGDPVVLGRRLRRFYRLTGMGATAARDELGAARPKRGTVPRPSRRLGEETT